MQHLQKPRGRECSECSTCERSTFQPSLNLSLLFSWPYRHTCTTEAAQLFWDQSLTHSFHRDGGCTPFQSFLFTIPLSPSSLHPSLVASLLTPRLSPSSSRSSPLPTSPCISAAS